MVSGYLPNRGYLLPMSMFIRYEISGQRVKIHNPGEADEIRFKIAIENCDIYTIPAFRENTTTKTGTQ